MKINDSKNEKLRLINNLFSIKQFKTKQLINL